MEWGWTEGEHGTKTPGLGEMYGKEPQKIDKQATHIHLRMQRQSFLFFVGVGGEQTERRALNLTAEPRETLADTGCNAVCAPLLSSDQELFQGKKKGTEALSLTSRNGSQEASQEAGRGGDGNGEKGKWQEAVGSSEQQDRKERESKGKERTSTDACWIWMLCGQPVLSKKTVKQAPRQRSQIRHHRPSTTSTLRSSLTKKSSGKQGNRKPQGRRSRTGKNGRVKGRKRMSTDACWIWMLCGQPVLSKKNC